MVIILIYSFFVLEESIRISNNLDAKPLIVLNKEYNYDKVTYNSIGFKLTNRYGFAQLNYDNDEKVILGQELWLFNVFLLWGWIN